MTILRKLTLREQRFVREYQLCGNASKAAIAAGYSAKTSRNIGYELLSRPVVSAALNRAVTRTLSKLDITVDRVLQERARLAFFDPRKLLDNTGRPLALDALDDDTAAAIAGLEVQDKFEKASEGKDGNVSTVLKYKLADKSASLTAIEKYLGMYKEDGAKDSPFNIIINLG